MKYTQLFLALIIFILVIYCIVTIKSYCNPKIYGPKIISIFNNKYEKIEDGKSFGFIIITNVTSDQTDKYWRESITCIRKYYSNKIIIINDNSNPIYSIDISSYENVEKINSEYKGRGELLPYFYFYNNRFFDKAIIIHDSMFINKYIDFNKIYNAFFCIGKSRWDHTDAIIDKLSYLNESVKLIDIYKNKKDKWNMCFGAQMITTYDLLKTIVDKYNLFILLDKIKTRNDRMDFERIIGLLYSIETDFKIKNLFGDIHDYTFPDSLEDYMHLKQTDKLNNSYIIKLFSGR